MMRYAMINKGEILRSGIRCISCLQGCVTVPSKPTANYCNSSSYMSTFGFFHLLVRALCVGCLLSSFTGIVSSPQFLFPTIVRMLKKNPNPAGDESQEVQFIVTYYVECCYLKLLQILLQTHRNEENDGLMWVEVLGLVQLATISPSQLYTKYITTALLCMLLCFAFGSYYFFLLLHILI